MDSWLAECLLSLCVMGGPGVEPRGLHYFYKPYISQPNEGHVAPNHWATCPLLICFQYDTCHHMIEQPPANNNVPHLPLPCQHDGTACHVAVRTVRTCTVIIFSLFDFSVKMRYLLHTVSVWHKNYTTGIRKTSRTSWCWFRWILSTFIFEHFSCPDGLLNPISDQRLTKRNLATLSNTYHKKKITTKTI